MTAIQEQARRSGGLSVTADGRQVPDARARLATGRLPADRLRGWVVTLGVTALAALMRFVDLGTPRRFAFDETYYAKDGWSLWQHGYAQNWVDRADRAIEAGRVSPDLQTGDPTMVVHPELGKWLIGLGEQVAGFDPAGWRTASVVSGSLMVLIMVRLARRLTGSTLLGGLAGLLVAFDGLHFALSRLALLDIFVATFLTGAVACLVADRDWTRARMAALAGDGDPGRDDWGPVRGLWWRPWRLAAGVMFGLALSSKWSALVPLAGFGLLVWAWDSGARRSLGVRAAGWRSAVVDALPAFGYLVGVAGLVYVASWTGWLVNADVYEAHLADNAYGPPWGDYTLRDPDGFWPSLFQALRSLAHYHHDVWAFHSRGLVDATHAYQSSAHGWLVMHRPVVAAIDSGIVPGEQGCAAPTGSTCVRDVLLLGNPVLWWSAAVALLFSVHGWLARRDWRHGLVLVGVLTTWAPFLGYGDRPIFSFYAVVTLPFLVLALTMLLGRVLGPARAGPRRRLVGAVGVGTVVVLVVVVFAWLYPVHSYGLLTSREWLDRVWFRSWV